jgi:hypothetical protein
VEWSYVVNEDLVRAVEEKIQENRRFTILSLSLHFPQISPSLLHEIVSDKLCFQKLRSRWVQQASVLTFVTWYSEQGEDVLNYIVTGQDMGVAHNLSIEAAVCGTETHIIANKEKIQTEHLNSQDHVHSVMGQKRRSACAVLASRLNNQHRCLLQHTQETASCNPEQATWRA